MPQTRKEVIFSAIIALSITCFSARALLAHKEINSSSENKCLRVNDILQQSNIYNNKSTNVCGHLTFKHEDINLYSNKKSARQHLRKECVSVAYIPEIQGKLLQFSGKNVIVHGIVKENICPKDSICLASCSDIGIVVDSVKLN
jgi:hypothetical protein